MMPNSLNPNPFLTGPWHNLVARPRATSDGHVVLVGIHLEVIILIRNFGDLYSEFINNILTHKSILLQRELHHLCIDFLLSVLHNLQRSDSFCRQLGSNLLELVELVTAFLLSLPCLCNSLLELLQCCWSCDQNYWWHCPYFVFKFSN